MSVEEGQQEEGLPENGEQVQEWRGDGRRRRRRRERRGKVCMWVGGVVFDRGGKGVGGQHQHRWQ
eukprot:CAMPEP_0182511790 /NCGR_PEP_ID=MMETSP1321-20130603/31052_1 /TAXON_ID=91990 /ORGANISM="Bolidomonas sp., Strain RCC1657" /LENGTH=64 /DNA_ID=CAMNT_0024718503 /DNA_START=924 /DNA_END=1115 /DNA_ORIENTATION=+